MQRRFIVQTRPHTHICLRALTVLLLGLVRQSSEDCVIVQVVVTHLRADAIDVREVDWTRPTAIVLGNERAGGHACPALSMCHGTAGFKHRLALFGELSAGLRPTASCGGLHERTGASG